MSGRPNDAPAPAPAPGAAPVSAPNAAARNADAAQPQPSAHTHVMATAVGAPGQVAAAPVLATALGASPSPPPPTLPAVGADAPAPPPGIPLLLHPRLPPVVLPHPVTREGLSLSHQQLQLARGMVYALPLAGEAHQQMMTCFGSSQAINMPFPEFVQMQVEDTNMQQMIFMQWALAQAEVAFAAARNQWMSDNGIVPEEPEEAESEEPEEEDGEGEDDEDEEDDDDSEPFEGLPFEVMYGVHPPDVIARYRAAKEAYAEFERSGKPVAQAHTKLLVDFDFIASKRRKARIRDKKKARAMMMGQAMQQQQQQDTQPHAQLHLSATPVATAAAAPAPVASAAASSAAPQAAAPVAAAAASAAASPADAALAAAVPLTADQQLLAFELGMISLSALDPRRPQPGLLTSPPSFAMVLDAGSMPNFHPSLATPELAAMVAPFLVEFASPEAASKAWDAFVKASKAHLQRGMLAFMILVTRVYYPQLHTSMTMMPTAYLSFCSYGMRKFLYEVVLNNAALAPSKYDEPTRTSLWRSALVVLHVCQLVSLEMMESLFPMESLFDVLDGCLNPQAFKLFLAWSSEFPAPQVKPDQVRQHARVDGAIKQMLSEQQWRQVQAMLFSLQSITQERRREAEKERRRVKAQAAAQALGPAGGGPAIAPGGPPHHQQSLSLHADPADVVLSSSPPALSVSRSGAAPPPPGGALPEPMQLDDDDELQCTGTGHSEPLLPQRPPPPVPEHGHADRATEKFFIKRTHGTPDVLVAAVRELAGDDDGGVDAGSEDGQTEHDVEVLDRDGAAPLPPLHPPSPSAQMPALQDTAGDEVVTSGQQYDDDSHSGRSEGADDEDRRPLSELFLEQVEEEDEQKASRPDAARPVQRNAVTAGSARAAGPRPRVVAPSAAAPSAAPSSSPDTAADDDEDASSSDTSDSAWPAPPRDAHTLLHPIYDFGALLNGDPPAAGVGDDSVDFSQWMLMMFLAVDGPNRLAKLLCKEPIVVSNNSNATATQQPPATPTAAAAVATSAAPASGAAASASLAVPSPANAGGDTPMTPTSSPSAPSVAPSSASAAAAAAAPPPRDYPPLLFSYFAPRILEAAGVAATDDYRSSAVHLTCPSLWLIRRISMLYATFRGRLVEEVQSPLFTALFSYLAPRIQFLTEAQIKFEPSGGIHDTIKAFVALLEHTFFYSGPGKNTNFGSMGYLVSHPRLRRIDKEELEAFEVEYGARMLRCSFLEKRIGGLKIMSRFLEDSDALRHPPRSLAALRAVRGVDVNTGRRKPACLVGARACDLINQHQFIETLFGEGMHLQLVKRSTDPIRYLAQQDSLTCGHLEQIWTAARGKHESVVEPIFTVLIFICNQLRPRPAVYLYRRIWALPLLEYQHALVHLVSKTTWNLLGNHTSDYLWCHTHSVCDWTTMLAMYSSYRAALAEGQAAQPPPRAFIDVYAPPGPEPDLRAPDLKAAAKDHVFLTHSAVPPCLPFDDFPPGFPKPASATVDPAELPAVDRIRASKVEYFGIDILWRAFNQGNDTASNSTPAGSSAAALERDASMTVGASSASLPAILRDYCWGELRNMFVWPEFAEPRPTCARRIEFMDHCVANVRASHNVVHSLMLLRDLLETFTFPDHGRPTHNPDRVGQLHAIAWLDSERDLMNELWAEMQRFALAVAQRIKRPPPPEADSHSLAFWQGPRWQLLKRLDFFSYLMTGLKAARQAVAEAKQLEVAANSYAAATLGVPEVAPCTAAASTDAASAAPGAVAPVALDAPSAPVAPVNPFLASHFDLLFSHWLLPAFMSDDLRDSVYQWLARQIESRLVPFELVLHIYHTLVPKIDFSALSISGFGFIYLCFTRINVEQKAMVWDHAASSAAASAANRHVNPNRRANMGPQAQQIPPEPRVLAYPLDGLDYLWRAALHAHDRVVSQTAMTNLTKFYTQIDPSIRGEINVRYEEAIARAMTHIHDCTVAIQNSGARTEEMSISMADTPAPAAASSSCSASPLTASELVSELGRGFAVLSNFLRCFEGDKPESHEAMLKRATAPPPLSAADSKSAAHGQSLGDAVVLELRLGGTSEASMPRLKLRLPGHSSLLEVKQAFIREAGFQHVKPEDIAVTVSGSMVIENATTVAALDGGNKTFLMMIKAPAKQLTPVDQWAAAIARMKQRTAEFEAREKLAKSFVPASTDAPTLTASAAPSAPPMIDLTGSTESQSVALIPYERKDEAEQEEKKEGGGPAAMDPTTTARSIADVIHAANAANASANVGEISASPPAEEATGAATAASVPVSAPAPIVVHHPASILSRPEYFQQLFSLLSLSIPASSSSVASARTSHIAEHAWRLLMQLPTNAQMLQRLKTLNSADVIAAAASSTAMTSATHAIQWDQLLPGDSLHQLYYSMQIVYAIIPHRSTLQQPQAPPAAAAAVGAEPSAAAPTATAASSSSMTDVAAPAASAADAAWNADEWEQQFVARGGLRHLCSVLVQMDFLGAGETATSSGAHSTALMSPISSVSASPMPSSPLPGSSSALGSAPAIASHQSQQTFECLSLMLKIILHFTHALLHSQPAAVGVDSSSPAPPSPPALVGAPPEADVLKPQAVSASPIKSPKPTPRKRKAAEEAAAAAAATGATTATPASPAAAAASSSLSLSNASKRRAIAPVHSEAFLLELESVFTFDVVLKLFRLWLEVARLQSGPSATAEPQPAPKNNNAVSSSSAVHSEVLTVLIRDSMSIVRDILSRSSSHAIAHRFFFQQLDTVPLWLDTLLTSHHDMTSSVEHLLEIARFWATHGPASSGSHLSRHILHVALDMLLSPERQARLVEHWQRSQHLMGLPRSLLQQLSAEIIASSNVLSPAQLVAAERWTPRRLLPLNEVGAKSLRINGIELLYQLFAKIKSYPSNELFGSDKCDQTLSGYISLARELVAILTVTPPSKLVQLPLPPAPEVAAETTEEEKKTEAVVVPAAPIEVHMLPADSAMSRLVESQQWLKFVFDECLFAVCPVVTPLDVPNATTLPRCKEKATRDKAFALLRELAQTSRRNFMQLQQLCLEQQRSREDDELGSNYAPDAAKKKAPYSGLVNQGATCYMNSLMQQLFMVPEFRSGILAQQATDLLTSDEERADSLMYQLQSIFSHLQSSDYSSFNAEGFCAAYKDYDGCPMAKGVQMDVNEFFNVLFDKLEASLKGTPHANLLDHVFGGKLSNQLLGRDATCTHTRSRDESFYILSLDVKGKKNVVESLKSFVEGEMLDGDNKFQCGECNRKVDTLKRVCVQSCPNNLILHLKRFEFDLDSMTKIKLNDSFEFPMELDLHDYTIEGLEAAAAAKEEAAAREAERKPNEEKTEGGAAAPASPAQSASALAASIAAAMPSLASAAASSVDRSQYLYELSGVIIHTGTAGSGHYYSFIRERCPLPSEDHASKHPGWHCFNDSRVDPFDIRQLGEQCFGGMASSDDNQWYSKPYSAYMLFYERKSMVHRPHAPRICPIPAHEPAQAMREEKEEIERVHSQLAASMPAHLPTAKETFAPLAKAAGLTVEDASEKKHAHPSSHGVIDVITPGAAATSSSHKRKTTDVVEESKTADAAEAIAAELDDDDVAAPLSALDLARRVSCEAYRSHVSEAPASQLIRCLTVEEQNALLPLSLFESIWRENTSLARDVYLFDNACLEFMFNYAVRFAYDFTPDYTDRYWNAETDELQMRCVRLALSFVVSVLQYARNKTVLPHWDADLIRMLSHNIPASRYFLDFLAEHVNDIVVPIYLVSGSMVMKKSFTAVVIAALATVRPMDKDALNSYEAPPPSVAGSKAASVAEGSEAAAEEHKEKGGDESAQPKKKQRTADGAVDADGLVVTGTAVSAAGGVEQAVEGEIDMADAAPLIGPAPPAAGADDGSAAEASEAEAEEAEQEEEAEEIPELAEHRPTSTGRFLGALLEMSPLRLVENYQRQSAFWSLMLQVSAMGDEELRFLMFKYETVLLALWGILGADCKIIPAEDVTGDAGWIGLIKLRTKRKGFSIVNPVQLIAKLLAAALVVPGGGVLDSQKLVGVNAIKRALDHSNLYDLLMLYRDETDMHEPVGLIMQVALRDNLKLSEKVCKAVGAAVDGEDLSDQTSSLHWIKAIMSISDEFQSMRISVLCSYLWKSVKTWNMQRAFEQHILGFLQWMLDMVGQDDSLERDDSDDDPVASRLRFLLREACVSSKEFLRMSGVTWIVHDDAEIREHTKELWWALAKESRNERLAREEFEAKQAAKKAAKAAAKRAAAGAGAMDEGKSDEEEEAESGEDEEVEGEEEEEPESHPFRSPSRRSVLYDYLVRQLAKHAEHATTLILTPLVPKLGEFWFLLRQLTETVDQKQTILGEQENVMLIRRVLPIHAPGGGANDPAREQLIRMLEHILWDSKSEEEIEELRVVRKAELQHIRDTAAGTKAAARQRLALADASAIFSWKLDARRPIDDNWRALSTSPDIASELANMPLSVLRVKAPEQVAANRRYLNTTFGKTWSERGEVSVILARLVQVKPALLSSVYDAQAMKWALINMTIKEDVPKIEALLSAPDGLFRTMLRVSDNQQPEGVSPFRQHCINGWWAPPKEADKAPHAWKLALHDRPYWGALGRQLKYTLWLLRSEKGAAVEDALAAAFVKCDGWAGFRGLLIKLGSVPVQNELREHLPAIVELLWQLFGRSGPAVSAALEAASQSGQSFPPVTPPPYFNEQLGVGMVAGIPSVASKLMHWYLPKAQPAAPPASAAAAPAASAAAAPAAAPAALPFPGLPNVYHLDPTSLRRLRDILLVISFTKTNLAWNSGLVIKALISRRGTAAPAAAAVAPAAATAAMSDVVESTTAASAADSASSSLHALAPVTPSASAPTPSLSSLPAVPAETVSPLSLVSGPDFALLARDLVLGRMVVESELQQLVELTLLEDAPILRAEVVAQLASCLQHIDLPSNRTPRLVAGLLRSAFLYDPSRLGPLKRYAVENLNDARVQALWADADRDLMVGRSLQRVLDDIQRVQQQQPASALGDVSSPAATSVMDNLRALVLWIEFTCMQDAPAPAPTAAAAAAPTPTAAAASSEAAPAMTESAAAPATAAAAAAAAAHSAVAASASVPVVSLSPVRDRVRSFIVSSLHPYASLLAPVYVPRIKQLLAIDPVTASWLTEAMRAVVKLLPSS